jgi:glycosyltransferase involved in cell wall biosynthesis
VPYKCCDVLIEAFAGSAALREHRLVIAGDGPERAALGELVATHGLTERVQFVGWKNQAEIAELMRAADVFAFPSIRELGAGVVIEAMACGCVPVVVDYGGPGGLVDEACGQAIPLGAKPELVAGFARALEALAGDRVRLASLRAAGTARARDGYSWEAKARSMLDVYAWALGRRAAPPDGVVRPERAR